MRRALFLIFLLLSSYSRLFADYEPILLAELIDKANFIVYAEIQTVQNSAVLVKPISIMKGKYSLAQRISISKFQNWTCAQRFAQYQAGQRIIFFLIKQKNQASFHVLGAGNEGEIPVFNDKVYYKQNYLAIDKHPTAFKVYDGVINGYSYSLDAFKNAVKEYVLKKTVVIDSNSADTTAQKPASVRMADELKSHR